MSDLDRCKKYLRSVLLASKCGIPIKQVSREYSYLYEEDIPFRKLNFPSLEKFLKSIPDVCMMSQRKGEMMVEVVGTQATSHIKNLVQNTGKKKGGGGGGAGGFRGTFPGSYNPWARSGQASPRQKSRHSQVSVTLQAGLGFKARKQKLSQLKVGGGGGRGGSDLWLEQSPARVLKVTSGSVKVWGHQVLHILTASQEGGLAQEQVEKSYQAKHGETLPQLWTKTLIQAGLIDLDNENRLKKTPLVIPAKVSKAGQFGFYNQPGADSRFRFSELIKKDQREQGRPDFLPDVETKMKELNIAGIRPMSEGWVGGQADAGTSELEPQRLPAEGDFYDCKVSHVVSPGEIYVQSYSSLAKYDQMNKLISAFYKMEEGSRDVLDPEPGMLVAVNIEKDWCRAQVIFKLGNVSNTTGGSDCLVKLVDIGKVEVVNIRSMRVLEKCFPALPVQALQVKLVGVERNDETTKVVLRRMCLGKVMVGHVIKREMDSVYLILYDTTLEADVNININLKELS